MERRAVKAKPERLLKNWYRNPLSCHFHYKKHVLGIEVIASVSQRADLSTLSCNKEEKNHQTSHFEHVRSLQSTKQLWAQALTSINQATLSTGAHFNQPSNFECRPSLQSTKQLWAQTLTSINQATLSAGAHFNQPSNIEQHMAWDLLLLPASTADSTLLPHTKDKWTHIPLHPFWAWYPLMRPHGLDMAIWWYHRRSEGSQDHNGRYFSSWIDLTVTESASKSSAVSA